jgi:Uma2 family endonuclease
VSWETYERLLSEHQDSPGTHFIYDEGELEIMVLSARHEHPNRLLEMVVRAAATELDIDFFELGSTTFKREPLQKGFEPDSAFYFGADAVAAETRDNAGAPDHPPHLIIEVEISTPSLSRFPIFAAFGVRELWRYSQGRVIFHRLENREYVEIEHSIALPAVSADAVSRLVEDRGRMRGPEWTRHVQDWARQLR